MQFFLMRRLAETVVLVLFISVEIFCIMNLAPGGPFDQLRASGEAGEVSAEDVARLNKLLGLDKPLHERYVVWLGNVFQGDLGQSWKVAAGQPVIRLIQQRLGNTVQLALISLLVSVAIAIPVGIYSALHQYSKLDYLITSLAFFGHSMPTFWFGLMVIIIFAVNLHWLPSSGMTSPGEGDLADRVRHLILPVAVLSLGNVAGWTRDARAMMLEVMRQDYVRTARAMGLGRQLVVFKYALRNTLIPLVTLIALAIPSLFDGAIVTE